MRYETNSEDYETKRLTYPQELNLTCVLCGSKVSHQYADAGKMVHTLQGDINQVVNLYSCTNEDCELSQEVFNPAPRFDYSDRHFGADVFKLIAEEYLVYGLKSKQIHDRLIRKYSLSISPQTVSRICDDILRLKSHKIDENTSEIISDQGKILLGFDGQDPGDNAPSIWCFIDLISGRVLATRKYDSVDHEILHNVIEEIRDLYDVEIVGWVSDKQNAIVKCHEVYYSEIHHQYCQYHYLRNTWNHLKALDSNIYMPLKKTINNLYIHSASRTSKVFFENVGKVSVREAFKNTDNDLQVMITARNKTFKELRGLWLHDTLSEYVRKMDKASKELVPSFRFTKIFKRTISSLKEALEEVKPYLEDVMMLEADFQDIRRVLADEGTSKMEKIQQLDHFYDAFFARAKQHNPKLLLEECRSFQPNKNHTTAEVMGEWCRLWESYRPGLFQYYHFPEAVKTNMFLEQAFSKQKQSVIDRVAKGNVSHVVTTRGEDVLRLKHCTLEELEADIVEEYSDELVKQLRGELRTDIQEQTQKWRTKSKEYDDFTADLGMYHQEMENEIGA